MEIFLKTIHIYGSLILLLYMSCRRFHINVINYIIIDIRLIFMNNLYIINIILFFIINYNNYHLYVMK